MSPQDYLKQRVDDQIAWYDNKSRQAQRWFKCLRTLEILAAGSIPLIAGFAPTEAAAGAALLVGILGALVVVLTSFLSLNKFQEDWIQYRSTCESLRHEKFLFLTRTEPYAEKDPFTLFVKRIEGLISKENSAWLQYARASSETPKPKESKKG